MKSQSAAVATPFGDAVAVSGETVTIGDERALQGPAMDALVRDAVFGGTVERERARWLIWELAQQVGARPSSIHELYRARGRGETKGFTVPAINVRGAAYDTARAIFRTAVRIERRRVHRRDRALRDRLHRTAPRRIRRGDARRGAARGIPRAGVHPGRPFPGERQEIRGGCGRRREVGE